MKLIFALLLSFGLVAQEAELPPLVVGTSSGYAPFVSLNDHGDYEGFDIDVATELAARLHRKLVLKDLGSMPSLMLALKQGKIDLLIWAVSITAERAKHIDFVYYQGEKLTKMPFVFWKEVPQNIETIDDLSKIASTSTGKYICVEAGTSQEEILKNYPSVNLKYVDKITDALMEIKYGKSCGTTLDPSLIPALTAKYPELKVLEIDLPEDQQVQGVGICVSPVNKELFGKVQSTIAEMQQDGTILKLEKKWNLAQ